MTTLLHDVFIIAKRDVIRNLRQKNQIVAAIARPLLWLFLLGIGLGKGFTGLPVGMSLVQFTFPGIVVMNIIFTGVMSGASIIWDREFGFLKAVQVAPVNRLAIIGGKTLGGTVIAVLHGLLVFMLFPFLHLTPGPAEILLSVAGMIPIGIASSALGVMLATRISSIEGFGTVNNLLVMPLVFLSGALYPMTNVPQWLKYVIYFNPFAYAADMLRGVILGINAYYLFDVLELLLFSIVVFSLASGFTGKDPWLRKRTAPRVPAPVKPDGNPAGSRTAEESG